MKNVFTICFALIFITLISYNSYAQVKSQFIPDIEGKIQSSNSTTVYGDGLKADYAGPNFTMYPGFPVQHFYTVFSPKTGGIFCNMDSDADMEIVFGAGANLYAVNLDGSSVPGWPKTFPQFYEVAWAPSFGDIDGDGEGEVVAGTGGTPGGTIEAFEKDGTPVIGFPIPFERYTLTPVLADLDGDNALEIIIGARSGKMYVYKGDGTVYPGWPYQMDGFTGSSASVGDINNDGTIDIIGESVKRLYAWDKDGNVLPGFPIAVLDSTQGSNSYSAPLLIDVNNDGTLEISFCSHSNVPGAGGITYLIKHDGTSMPGWPKLVDNWIYGAPVAADIDNDNEYEILIAEYGSSLTPFFYIYAYNIDGSVVTGFPHGPYNGTANQLTIADIDNDSQFEIIFDENVQVGDSGRYQAIELDGSTVAGWPLTVIRNTSFQQPLLGDLNNDGTLDMVGGSFNFDFNNKEVFVFVWDTGLPYNRQTIVNPMYQFGPTHNGVFIDPLSIPVELESFTSSVSGNTIKLNWVTITENNNLGFRVYRNDMEIAFIEGHGTSLDRHSYAYSDLKMTDGVYIYRLEQVDYDGTVNQLGTVTATVENISGDFILEQNYPNPFNPVTRIRYNIPEQSKVKIEIVNVLGQVVDILTEEVYVKGNHTKFWNAANNPSGIYFAILKAESEASGNYFIQTIKMNLIK